MVMATAIKLAMSKDGKPRELNDVVEVLVKGADKENGSDDAENEYLDESWWETEDDAGDLSDGSRGDD